MIANLRWERRKQLRRIWSSKTVYKHSPRTLGASCYNAAGNPCIPGDECRAYFWWLLPFLNWLNEQKETTHQSRILSSCLSWEAFVVSSERVFQLNLPSLPWFHPSNLWTQVWYQLNSLTLHQSEGVRLPNANDDKFDPGGWIFVEMISSCFSCHNRTWSLYYTWTNSLPGHDKSGELPRTTFFLALGWIGNSWFCFVRLVWARGKFDFSWQRIFFWACRTNFCMCFFQSSHSFQG